MKYLKNTTEEVHFYLLSKVEPNNFDEARIDTHWTKYMKEELNYIEKNLTKELIPRTKGKNVVGTTWVFINKLNQDGQVVINRSRLVCKGYAQVEGIYFEETFSHVAWIEPTRMFMAYTCAKNIIVYQMDIKSTFLNG